MAALTLPDYHVEDLDGHLVEAEIEDLGASFGYTLPKDKFRQPYIARQVRVTVPVHLAAFVLDNLPALRRQSTSS